MSTSDPLPVTLDEVVAAQRRIDGRLRTMPLLTTTLDTRPGPVEVVFALEMTQVGGCFKTRGSLNAVVAAQETGQLTDAGVIVASGGNAAIGAAWAARMVGTRATVVVPETAPAVKVAALQDLGAVVHRVGMHYADAAAAAVELARETGAYALHAYDHPEIVAGAGTIGLDLIASIEGRLTTVVCVGGGGLIAGISATLRPGDRLVGAEPVGASTLAQALAHGRPTPVSIDSVAADSLGATRIGDICWASVTHRSVESVVVDDADIIAARAMMWDRFRLVIEHGTATAVAAVTTGVVRAEPDSTLCIVLCGANTTLVDTPGNRSQSLAEPLAEH